MLHGLHPLLVGGVNVHWDGQRSEMLPHERFDLVPFQSADTGSEARQGKAPDAFPFHKLVEFPEAEVEVVIGGATGSGVFRGGGFLGEQVDDPTSVRTGPDPESSGRGMRRVQVVAEVLVERRPVLTEREREPGIEVIIRGNAVGNGVGRALEKISGNEVDPASPPSSSIALPRQLFLGLCSAGIA